MNEFDKHQATLGEAVPDIDDTWNGMPEFVQDGEKVHRKIIISFKSEDDVKKFAELLDQRITDKTKSLWYPAKEKSNKISMWIDDEGQS